MKTALLVVDLEGVAGVDQLDSLLAGAPGYPAACALLTAEVAAAARGFFSAGFDRVRVSDSHRSGSDGPNVVAALLPEGVELRYEADAFTDSLFDGVSAAACLGMHAAAGSRGFAAHTLTVHCAVEAGRRGLSEADLFLGLCAARKVPVAFVAGDDVLKAALRGRARTVVLKRSRSPSGAASVRPERARELLFQAAQRSPRPAPALPAGVWRVRFKSRWQAVAAERAGAVRVGERTIRLEGGSPRERYQHALRAVEASEAVLGQALRGAPGESDFREDAVAALLRPMPRERLGLRGTAARNPAKARRSGLARRALAAFLDLTLGPLESNRALRALTLHMLEAHAPRFFRAARAGAPLRAAVAALAYVPTAFPAGLDPDVGMARLDALYVRRERGLPAGRVNRAELARYVVWVGATYGPLPGWLLAELACAFGGKAPALRGTRPLRPSHRVEDLYWTTHLFLLETRYLRRPLAEGRLERETEELLLATPWVVEQGLVDLAAEVAFCLQVAGEASSAEHGAALALVVRSQGHGGAIVEPRKSEWTAEVSARQEAHCTAAGLLALAGVEG